jgi:hypothetical protein
MDRLCRHILAVTALSAVVMACGRDNPPEDTNLLLRQRSLGTTAEMAISAEQIDIVVTSRKQVIDRTSIKIPAVEAAKIRRLFWVALLRPPASRGRPLRDLDFEQEWRGAARSYEVRIQGPLTPDEYRAYDYVNSLLPPQKRFLIDFGPRRRSKRTAWSGPSGSGTRVYAFGNTTGPAISVLPAVW